VADVQRSKGIDSCIVSRPMTSTKVIGPLTLVEAIAAAVP
jgi:hypothetical protein